MTPELYSMIMASVYSGDETVLRACPAGRAFLCDVKKEQRQVPLAIRRMPRLLGEAAGRRMHDMRMEVLTKQGQQTGKERGNGE